MEKRKERYRIGVDLGGTDIKVGLVDQKSRIRDQMVCATRVDLGAERVIQRMAETVRALLERSGVPDGDVAGVGIGCPGLIDGRNGVVLTSNNFGWEDLPLVKLLSRELPWPIAVRNDAECAGLAEAAVGGGAGCKNLVMLTLGTGVGSCIIVDGKLLEGTGGGGIAGHTIIRQGGRKCTCGKRGCLEAYASATALVKQMRRQLALHPDSVIGALCRGDPDAIDGRAAFEAARQGDASAICILEEFTDALAVGIGNFIDLFRPEKVLLGGGLSNAGEQLLAPLRRKVPEKCFAAGWLDTPPIEAAQLKNEAGMIGAASLIAL